METPHKYTCHKCRSVFRDNYHLNRHLARKSPCSTIVNAANNADGLVCNYCNRHYTTKQALSRHINYRCRSQNTNEGEKNSTELMIHRQLIEQTELIKNLTTTVEERLKTIEECNHQSPSQRETVNNGNSPVTINITNNNIVNIEIHPWDSQDGPLAADIPAAVAAASAVFARNNERISRYIALPAYAMEDPDTGLEGAVELLVGLTEELHRSNPGMRNVYLNPRREDQVRVYKNSGWDVHTIQNAVHALLLSAAKAVRLVGSAPAYIASHPKAGRPPRVDETETIYRALTPNMISASIAAERIHHEKPGAVEKAAHKGIVAHLANETKYHETDK